MACPAAAARRTPCPCSQGHVKFKAGRGQMQATAMAKGLMAADMHSTPESMERRTGGRMPMVPCSRWLREIGCSDWAQAPRNLRRLEVSPKRWLHLMSDTPPRSGFAADRSLADSAERGMTNFTPASRRQVQPCQLNVLFLGVTCMTSPEPNGCARQCHRYAACRRPQPGPPRCRTVRGDFRLAPPASADPHPANIDAEIRVSYITLSVSIWCI